MKRLRRLLFAVLASVVLLSGCINNRPKTAVVRGTVTYHGKPVPNGTILFIPAADTTAMGEIGPDGSYRLTTFEKGDGALLGTHKVVIVALQDTGLHLPEERSALAPPIIPQKYMYSTTTDLRAEVQEGENIFDFDLKDDKKK